MCCNQYHKEVIAKIVPKDTILKILYNCKKYNKQVITYSSFLFENYIYNDISLQGLNINYIEITKEHIPQGRFGKLWYINKPIVEILSTRTSSGKFSAQIMLRKKLKDKGYNVGYISTEPQGILFKANKIFPYGYNSSVKIDTNDYVPVINEMLHNLDEKQYDIILTGGQSGILSYDLYNTSRILISQLAFHYGVNPDCVILCINLDDEVEYIERTIKYIESSSDTKVIAFIVFPKVKEMRGLGCFIDRNIIGTKNYKQKIIEMEQKFNIPVFENNENSIEKCTDFLIKILTE